MKNVIMLRSILLQNTIERGTHCETTSVSHMVTQGETSHSYRYLLVNGIRACYFWCVPPSEGWLTA